MAASALDCLRELDEDEPNLGVGSAIPADLKALLVWNVKKPCKKPIKKSGPILQFEIGPNAQGAV
jgi:hypothetical protein